MTSLSHGKNLDFFFFPKNYGKPIEGFEEQWHDLASVLKGFWLDQQGKW